MVAHFVAEFTDQSVDVTIVNFVEPLVCEAHVSFEEDPAVIGGGVVILPGIRRSWIQCEPNSPRVGVDSGVFKVKVEGEPIAVSVCTCVQCQKRTGSAFGMGAYFLRDNVQVVSGTFNTFIRPGDSGAKLSIYFCPTCGSSIFWERDTPSDYLGLRLGVLPIPGFIWRL